MDTEAWKASPTPYDPGIMIESRQSDARLAHCSSTIRMVSLVLFVAVMSEESVVERCHVTRDGS